MEGCKMYFLQINKKYKKKELAHLTNVSLILFYLQYVYIWNVIQ